MLAPDVSTIRILLLDDHAMMRAGLRLLIESEPKMKVVAEAKNGREALSLAKNEQPDILLLDLALGEESSLDYLSELLTTARSSRAIILTGSKDLAEHQQAVALGAMGVVIKDQAMDVLLKAIERVHSGEVWLERSMIARVLNGFSPGGARKETAEEINIASLTESERKVIVLLCEGLSNKQLAERLFISESTVHNHLTAIFRKLDVSNRLSLVIYAFRHSLAQSQ